MCICGGILETLLIVGAVKVAHTAKTTKHKDGKEKGTKNSKDNSPDNGGCLNERSV